MWPVVVRIGVQAPSKSQFPDDDPTPSQSSTVAPGRSRPSRAEVPSRRGNKNYDTSIPCEQYERQGSSSWQTM
ncbi:hypothetical protein VPH35_020793 [Triticum aestivum]